MVSTIKNDAAMIGAGAVAAGTANVVYKPVVDAAKKAVQTAQRAKVTAKAKDVFKSVYTEAQKLKAKPDKLAAFKKAFSNAFSKKTMNDVTEKVMNTAKATFDKTTYEKLSKVLKENAKKSVKADTYKNLGKKLSEYTSIAKDFAKESGKNIWNKIATFGKTTNWKQAGIYAGIGAAVVTGIVVAKNIFSGKEEA